MILEYIEALRRQPLEVRRKAVAVWTAVVVVAVVVLYLLSLVVQSWLFSGIEQEESLLIAPYSEQTGPEN